MKGATVIGGLRAGGIATAVGLFLAVPAVLLHGVFVPGQTLFSNDGPLGQLMAECHRLPERFTGCWQDLNSVGFNGGAAAPGISFGLQWLLGPVWFSKLYAILSLAILGLGAWTFLRASKLHPLACGLGGVAAILNATFFSVACWGMGAHDLTVGMAFLALAALADTSPRQRWGRIILAGMAVGLGVTEGADVGALFSLLVAAFILHQAWTVEGPRAKNLGAGFIRLLLVTGCAAWLAAQSIHGLLATSINGVTGTRQDAATKTAHWNWATQWSLPKLETLNLVAPGVFGYRMDTPNGGVYWGAMGRDQAWDTYLENGRQGPPPSGLIRYTGGSNYAGGLVVLVAFWAAAQSLRRKNSVFDLPQRKWLWLWLAVAALSLMLAWGRFAPFYQLAYALPYFSTIRNPVKFLYFFQVALIVLFGFGVDGMYRRYLRPATASLPSRWPGLQNWWRQAGPFEKNWIYGCGVVWLASLLGWWIYARHRDGLVAYLQTVQIIDGANLVADFSIRQAGWFVAVFFLGAGLLALIFSGAFARHTALGGLCLALLLAGDLGLSDQPWIIYWNYPDKYASNDLFDQLRDKPYEHRVGVAPLGASSKQGWFTQLYRTEWLQQQFPYYNIQSYETVEMPRVPEDYGAFVAMLSDTNGATSWFNLARAWQLTATRYVLGPAGFGDYLGRQDHLPAAPLELVTRIGVEPKPGIALATRTDQVTAVADPHGAFALFDFTAALPRAKLYSRWLVITNAADTLHKMFDPAFDPAQCVLVAGKAPASPGDETNLAPAPGSAEIVHYSPKAIMLTADATAPVLLLLNDHFDPNWKVWVDGRPAELLRCNFLMRGVALTPGAHRIEFKFQPPSGWLYVSLAAMAVTVFVAATIAIGFLRDRATVPMAAAAPAAAAPAATAPAKKGRKPNARKTAADNRVVKR